MTVPIYRVTEAQLVRLKRAAIKLSVAQDRYDKALRNLRRAIASFTRLLPSVRR
jgi:hypothetical protein